MWAAAALSLYGGYRLEEVCQLKVADYVDRALRVREAKSNAGVRAVPVHAVLAPLVDRLAQTSTDGYLLPGLLTAGRDDKRSVYLSKRIQWHLRRTLKLTDKALVFHGLRHTFTNALERAGVALSTAQLVVGHSRRGSITYGAPGASYSSGLPLQQLADAVAKVTFGAVDGIVKSAAGDVKVTHRSARRPRAGSQ
jgi:integrase